MSYEKTGAAVSLPRGTAQTEWTEALEASKASSAASVLIAALLAPPSEASGESERPGGGARRLPQPLFLIHRALLL